MVGPCWIPKFLEMFQLTKFSLFVDALESFNDLLKTCFSTKVVKDDINELVEKSKFKCLQTGLSVTLKVHVILDHLVPTLNLPHFEGRGLGVCTEQAGESIHSHFKENFWKKWHISSLEHPQYSKNLKKAVVECASKAL